MTNNEIAVRQGSTQMTVPEKIQYSQALAVSTLLPDVYRNRPENLLYALEYAEALGVSPINAITSIHVIKGKPSASADLIAGLVRRAGHKLRITATDTSATAQIIRADDPEFVYESTWTIEKARQAGLLNSDTWKKFPSSMLRSRAVTEVARMGASDALYGVIYTPEELGAQVDAEGAVVAVEAGHVTSEEVHAEAFWPATEEQFAEYVQLGKDLGFSSSTGEHAGFMSHYGVNNFGELSNDQAGEIIDELRKQVTELAAAAVAVETGEDVNPFSTPADLADEVDA